MKAIQVMQTMPARFALLISLLQGSGLVQAHENVHLGVQVRELDWANPQISEVIVTGDSGKKTVVDGKACLTGRILHFGIRDDFAFDIDETVWLDVTFRVDGAVTPLHVSYDPSRSSAAPIAVAAQPTSIEDG